MMMITNEEFAARRAALVAAVGGPVLLMGNGTRARNLPMNALPFRQDSTLLYYSGCHTPNAALWLDADEATLYLPVPGDDDALWHGPTPTLETRAAALGLKGAPLDALESRALRERPATLAVADTAKNRWAQSWARTPLVFGREHGDDALVDAVIRQRRTKSAAEIDEMRRAAQLTAAAHRFAMAATKPGVTERALAALFDAYLAVHGGTPGYATILTQDGDILHNHDHDGVCTAGRLLLLDGGAERTASGYGADVTRTWPVSGRFTPRQRAAYEAVLEAQQAAIDACIVGTSYRSVHDAASSVLAQFLIDEGLIMGLDAEDAVACHAQALFFPHGVGHHLGLDVHDLENFGDRPSYAPGNARPEAFGTQNLRLDLPLEAGWVVTIEPGFYVVDAILEDANLRHRFAGKIDFDAANAWRGFGGIRIEDDVHITPTGPDILSDGAPKTVAEVEAAVGTGVSMDALL